MRPALDANLFPSPSDDVDARLTPIAGFDLRSYAKQTMDAADLDTTRMCPRLELEELREMARPSSTPPDPEPEPEPEPDPEPEPAPQSEPTDDAAEALDTGRTSLSQGAIATWRVLSLPALAVWALFVVLLASLRRWFA